MKRYLILLITICTISCTKEVVLDDITNSTPRLVVEASIDWNKDDDEASKTQTIKLTQSTSYYSQDYPVVNDAIINITDNNNQSMGTFTYDASQELYVATDFKKPTVGTTYQLTIEVDGQVYTASDTYTSIQSPNFISQTLNKDLDPEGIIQVDYNIDNEIGVDNYYLFKIVPPSRISVLPEYSNADDSLLSEEPGDNNYSFSYFEEELEPGDLLKISTYGISRRYNDFLNKIILTAQGSDGPFSTAPATIRGNILNTTNEDNRAYGYFSMNEFTYVEYVVKEKSDKEIVTEF
ncbi:DUF4249 domain-containing protein [Ochrovirga pacifica]|uniref:DUF4249 family protein n=1 Tax=Ochrovirga pacifica TaxID=1042376 RepID=UPI0002559AD2|nr:DUF4249 family protein [Ochrovirga pacifica]